MPQIANQLHSFLKSAFNYVPKNKFSFQFSEITYYLRAAIPLAYLNTMAFMQSLLSKEKADSKRLGH
jgi:hypothetical protein